MNYRQSFITATILLLFALVGTALVAFTYDSTRERIAANERATLQRKLNLLIPPQAYDNTLLEDTLQVRDAAVFGTEQPVTVYRARHGDAPVGLVMATTAPDGYSGTIRLLVGINLDGSLSGVRTLAHRETPGLGDKIGPEGNFAGLTDTGKWVLSVAMLIGRLELMVVLVLLTRTFWRG